MKEEFIISVFVIILLSSCNKEGIKYELYSNGHLAFEILPEDIEFYDTSQERGYIQIHEIRLCEGFYKQDSLLLVYPLEMICRIGIKKYFWAEHFFRAQSASRLYINFRFDPSCENSWRFNEGGPGRPFDGDTVILYTNNECNSIEFFHNKREIEQNWESYYETEEYFLNYIDTARLAHEILLDPYYLNAIKESGIPIR